MFAAVSCYVMIADLARISRDLRVCDQMRAWARQESIAQHPERSSSAFNPLVDLITKRCKVDWLGQKRLSAVLQRLTLRLRIAIGGDHDDWDVWSQRLGLGQEFKTAHARHVDVGEYQDE